MLSFDDINKIEYYVNQCEIYNLDVRQLRNKIKSNEYERIPVDTRNKLKSRNDIRIIDFVKNPIHIRNSNKKEIISEKILQKLILEDIPTFLRELGNGFTFIDKNIKTIEENDTVGIIICKQDNEYVIKYCSDDRIIAREYELIWFNV